MQQPNWRDAEPALTITDTRITSNATSSYAEWSRDRAADGNGAWVVHGDPALYGRCFDRNQAITAMTLEEEKAKPEPDQALIASLSRELWIEPEVEP
jgi:hypothetical protein